MNDTAPQSLTILIFSEAFTCISEVVVVVVGDFVNIYIL
jgi:hypothetical protein